MVPVVDAGSPAWSAISNKIIFWSGLEGFRGQIWIIDSDGNNRMQLTMPSKPPPQTQLTYPNNDDPRWSPDGKKILVSTNRTIVDIPSPPCPDPHCFVQVPEMWVMNADGSDQQFIVNNTFGPLPGDAAWQPVP
jgi:Tol biopolymer transport system component